MSRFLDGRVAFVGVIGTSVRDMRRPSIAGLVLGVLNAVVAVGALALVEVLTPDEFGWFAYAPLDDVVVQDPRFPWRYVVVPLALVATNVLALPAYVRSVLRR